MRKTQWKRLFFRNFLLMKNVFFRNFLLMKNVFFHSTNLTFFINKKLRRNARFLCVLRMFLWFLIKTKNILQYKIDQQAIKNGSKIGRSQKWKPLQNRWIIDSKSILNRSNNRNGTSNENRFRIDQKTCDCRYDRWSFHANVTDFSNLFHECRRMQLFFNAIFQRYAHPQVSFHGGQRVQKIPYFF